MALSLLSLLCSVNEHYILLIIHRLQSRVYTLQVNNSKNSNLFAYLGITLCLRVPTRSSAVAKRPRDASCLSVVSIVASIVQYLKRSFLLLVTSASHLLAHTIRFCSVVFGVTSIVIVGRSRAEEPRRR